MLTLILLLALLGSLGRRSWYWRRPMGLWGWGRPWFGYRPHGGFGMGRPTMGGYGMGRPPMGGFGPRRF